MSKLFRTVSPALLMLLIVVAAPGDAFDPDGVLYFRREPGPILLAGLNVSEDSLRIEEPTRDKERELGVTIPAGASRDYGPFFSTAATGPSSIDVDHAVVKAFLTTGRTGLMQCCAEVTATLARARFGQEDVIAQRSIITSLGPKRPLGSETPVIIPIAVNASDELRLLDTGDGLAVTLNVRNRCQDQAGRNVTFRYDGSLFPSRVEFPASPLDPNPDDLDADGFVDGCDNCPEAPNPTQTDGNFNGIGDICEACTPDSPDPRFCTCIGASCNDGDACTADSCSDEFGCQYDSVGGLDGLVCRVDSLVALVSAAAPPDVAVRLTRRRSPLQRSARKAARMVAKLQQAIQVNKSTRTIDRKLRKVSRVLTRFEKKLEKVAAKGLIADGLRTQIATTTDAAQANLEEVSAK